MSNDRKIRVFIVDDSRFFREFLIKSLSYDSQIQVIGTASDPIIAREKIFKLKPDVITMDIEMPHMNGIEFLKKLMPEYPVPVIMVSSINNIVFEALSAGAIDFVSKPSNNIQNIETFIKELILKVKSANNAKIINKKNIKTLHNNNNGSFKNKIIAIGASTGGTEAIYKIIKNLPTNIPGIVVVQHMPPVFTRMYAERLDSISSLTVKEAVSGDKVEKGKVLIAPGGKHIKIKKRSSVFYVECFEGEKVNGHCPSVDVLFNSIADIAESYSVGIILTGMGYDGTKGLLKMRKAGARTIGQDEESSVIYGMPRIAYNIGAVEKQVHLNKIPETLMNLLK